MRARRRTLTLEPGTSNIHIKVRIMILLTTDVGGEPAGGYRQQG